MKRFRTGLAAPPWAGGQTGPLTADVEALMSRRDPGPVKEPVKYVSPLNAPAESEPTLHTPVPEDEASLLDSLPAFKAAMESLEKRGDPILLTADSELPDLDPTTEPRPKAKRVKRKPRPIPRLKQITLRPAAPPKQSQPRTQ